jgi:DNA-binding Lrp family transcriptional regulator
VDALDLRLLRAMFRDDLFAITGINPWFTVTQLSRATGASRLTVRRRLSKWQKLGVWGRVMVYPNPASLGGCFAMEGFQVVGEPAQRRFLRLAALVVPAVMAFQTEDVWVFLVVSSDLRTNSPWTRELAAQDGVQFLGGPHRVSFPDPDGQLRPGDWACIAALRNMEELNWSAVARKLRMEPRAFRRRMVQLLERHQIFFYPYIDFSCSEGTVIHLATFLAPGADAELVRRSVTELLPDIHPIDPLFPTRTLLPPDLQRSVAGELQFMMAVTSMATTDRLRRQIGEIPGVCNTHVAYPVQNMGVQYVIDEMIAAASASYETLRPRTPKVIPARLN